MLRKKKKAPVEIQDPVLSDRLSFLDVIVETCKHSGRHTLIADTGDATYTVMIDSGGPFNADGGGLSGREVLVKAASLRHGTYTKLQGWPVDQPTYQLGLAQALQGPVMSTKPEETPPPPPAGAGGTGPGGGYGGSGGGGGPRRPRRAPHRGINRGGADRHRR